MKIVKRLLIIVPVVCGIALFAYMKNSRQRPVRLENRERVQTVRTMVLQPGIVVPQSVGYGYVTPEKTWEGIAEVSGKIVHMNKNLKKGFFFKKGELLVRIDTAVYGLAEKRGEADLMNVDAQLRELDQSRKNTQRLLAVEKKSLTISAQELKRMRDLFDKGVVSKSNVEKEERTFLAQQTVVNNLQNSLDLIPAKRKALLAQKESGESTVRQQRLDVEKTEVYAPFNCRLSAVHIEMDQYAPAGTVLVAAEGIDRAEVPVQLTPVDFMTLMPRKQVSPVQALPDMETIRRAIGITAKVRLPIDEQQRFQWEGWFSRTSESLDVKTGTITVYVTVENPYDKVIPGVRPPLVTNMYAAVALQGRPLENRFAIPRSAVHEGRIYLCNKEARLEIRAVAVEFSMGDLAILDQGVEPGETLVLSDLVPAISGMKLKPVSDDETAEQVQAQAAGEAL